MIHHGGHIGIQDGGRPSGRISWIRQFLKSAPQNTPVCTFSHFQPDPSNFTNFCHISALVVGYVSDHKFVCVTYIRQKVYQMVFKRADYIGCISFITRDVHDTLQRWQLSAILDLKENNNINSVYHRKSSFE